MRPSGRAANALRSVSIIPGFSHHAEGSCIIKMGGTEVLCTASVDSRVPPFLRGKGSGWVTAEYGMLPRSCTSRIRREAWLQSQNLYEGQMRLYEMFGKWLDNKITTTTTNSATSTGGSGDASPPLNVPRSVAREGMPA